MKIIFLSLTALFSFSTFADVSCSYRFNPRLAVTVVQSEGPSSRGKIIWDRVNTCAGDICTEIYPGAFNVRYRDITPPRTVGVSRFRIRAIAVRDDLGNRYRTRSLFGDFVRNARFTEVIIPEPNLSFRWHRRTHVMKCVDTEGSAFPSMK